METPCQGASEVQQPEGDTKWSFLTITFDDSDAGRQARRCHRCLMDFCPSERIELLLTKLTDDAMTLQLVHREC